MPGFNKFKFTCFHQINITRDCMPIKITFQKETQKLPKIPSNYSTLVSKIENLFKGKIPNPFILEYEDKDGETLHILDEEDYKTVLSNDLPHQLHTIKFNLLPIDPAMAQHIDSQIRKASQKANGELPMKDGPQKKFENKENSSSSGFLSMFNELLSEKLSCFEQITTHTDKKNQETKITINFKRNESKKDNPTAKLEFTTSENLPRKDRTKIHSTQGNFQLGDTPKSIIESSKKGDHTVFLIEWNKRPNGESPLPSEVTHFELQQFDPSIIKNFINKNKKLNTQTHLNEYYLDSKRKETDKIPHPETISASSFIGTQNLDLSQPSSHKINTAFHQNTSTRSADENSTYVKNLPLVFSKALKEENIPQLTELAQAIRKIVSEDYPPIEQLIQSGILPDILTLLDKKYSKHQDLLIEICWIIANVSSSNTEHVAKLIELNVVPKAIDLLQSKSEEINDNVIWILANIAGDSFHHRDILLKSNIVEKLDHIVTVKPFQPSFLNNVSWLISNLCRGKPYPQFDKIAPLLRIIKLLIQLDSATMLINCLFALSYLTEGDNEQIEIVLSYHMTPRIIDLLGSSNHEIQAPALRTIGNLLTGDDSHAQQLLISQGVLQPLGNLLSHSKKIFVKEACWAISNILAGDNQQIQNVLDYEDGKIIDKLLKIARECQDTDVLKEIAFCLTNPCSGASHAQILTLVEKGIIDVLLYHLRNYNGQSTIILSFLESLTYILEAGMEIFQEAAENPFLMEIEEKKGFRILEMLQVHPEYIVYETVSNIIEEFFVYDVLKF